MKRKKGVDNEEQGNKTIEENRLKELLSNWRTKRRRGRRGSPNWKVGWRNSKL
jgi:hypothetical protein